MSTQTELILMRIDADRLRNRFRGCMVGLACGDALGMPVETMTQQEILDATGGAGVTGYLAPLQKRFHSTARLQPGQWTDDTQLALAIARSLVRKRGFDLEDIAAEHVREYNKARRGWGVSTTRGIAELAEGKRRPGEPVLDPEAHGMGNGVAMKVAPLALATIGDDPAPMVVSVFALASFTHRDLCAVMGAVMVASAIQKAAAWMNAAGDGDPEFMICRVPLMAGAGSQCPAHGGAVFDACAVAVGTDAPRIAREILPKTQCDVRQSVPFVFSLVRQYFYYTEGFRHGVLAAVNAGGDTDSNAAMVGAMLGAFHGLTAIPLEWIEGLEAHDEIISLADQLFDLVCSRK